MNKVLAGRLAGKRIKIIEGTPNIMAKTTEGVPIDRLIVRRLQILNIVTHKSILSGFIRGYIGKILGNTMWISAIQSAKTNYHYLCKITYRDNSSSIIFVNSRVFNAISTRVDTES